MELDRSTGKNVLLGSLGKLMRACIYKVLSVGPIPTHFSFIMDGNRRYARKHRVETWEGHKAGTVALMAVLRYLYELGVKYITVYAFSIDNFKRKPEQVQVLMDLLLQKTEELLKQTSVVNVYGVRVKFIGNLNLLSKPVKEAAEKVMDATSKNSRAMLLVCVAYTSTDEIVHAVRESCKLKWDEIEESVAGNSRKGLIKGVLDDFEKVCSNGVEGAGAAFKGTGKSEKQEITVVKPSDVEKNLYMAVAPEPDILIRSSGETRLSNFLLWQTAYCPLYNPAALWPEIGFFHVIWAILMFQRNHSYLEKKKKQV